MSDKNNKKDNSKEEVKEEAKAVEEEIAVEEKPETVETEPVESETDILKKQLAEKNDQYLRILAEYDNYRRRSKQEKDNIYADVRGDTIVKFLPVYDNLVRAAEHETDEEAKQGAIAILAQFKTVLEGLGVTEIPAIGKKFDPALHNAVLHIDDEKYGEGEIVLELEKGFKLGDKVIRFSTVQVAN